MGWIPSVQNGTHSLDCLKMVMNHLGAIKSRESVD